MENAIKEELKRIPKIDELMQILRSRGVFESLTKKVILQVCRETMNELREAILENGEFLPPENEIIDRIEAKIGRLRSRCLRPVINATGIILHTNLGRAPLCEDALKNIVEVSRGYTNLEFNLEEGRRGSRYDHLKGIICKLSGAEDAIVVNNNAAAVLLALNTLAEGKEVIVSRGELVEIGGEFRIPEVMEKSNAILREIGATNKTHPEDYITAIGENTGLLFKAHSSNYKIIGFTGEVGPAELAQLGSKYGIPVMYDLGSGCFVDLDHFGLVREPTVQEAVATGIDVLTFSGDKLLGGPQAGIIVGKRDWIGKIARNPLSRALRIDKLTIAALEATLALYLGGEEKAIASLPALRALTEPLPSVEKRAKRLQRKIALLRIDDFTSHLKRDFSLAGGGSLPGSEIPTFLVGIRSTRISPNRIESSLRQLDPPIITRISEDEVFFDLRTLSEEDFPFILDGLQEIAKK